MKREPTLADEFLQQKDSEQLVTKQQNSSAKNNLLESKRFILDEESAVYIAEMIKNFPRIIADAQDFAIPPFTKTWIEFPFSKFWESVNSYPPLEDVDKRVGFLIVGNRIRIISGGEVSRGAVLLPHEYHLWSPMSDEQEIELIQKFGTSKAELDYIYWGSSINKLKTEVDREGLYALRQNHRIHFPEKDLARAKLFWDNYAKNTSGDLRNIIAILLFLNRTREMQVVDSVPHTRGIIKNKASTFLSYNKITLKLNPEPLLKTLVPGEGTWRKLHDVRGHFCHDKRAREYGHLWCAHEWIEYEVLKWVCEKCQGKRWWRHEHKRGNEEKGLVIAEYQVTK